MSGPRLPGRVALIVGGTGGMGGAVARRMGEEGARLALVYRQNEDRAAAAERDLRAAGYEAMAIRADVLEHAEAERAVAEAIARYGQLDIVVTFLGAMENYPLVDMPEAAWDRILHVCMKGVYNITHFALREMLPRRYGKIVNVGSMAYRGVANEANYSAARAALNGFTKAVGYEVARDGVNVNSIASGLIKTPRMGTSHPEVAERALRETPAARAGDPLDIANACVFLCSDEAGFICGHILEVSGGLH